MELQWTGKALSHLARLYDCLAPENRLAAARTMQARTAAPGTLLANPRMGEKLEAFEPRDVWRALAGHYRNALRNSEIHDLGAAAMAHARGSIT
ncbi:MAG: type II toxin-antitoxin system RelE/ParE family toxin [Thiobacillus sp.]|nr:type II toxin-antitoxin system RelE/ParE family toxin [Thiobacillus sp.]MDP3124527.1 type II toxin-antitoxin system RelE/ParE family toxin [Thiobacillus sp.]